MHRPLLAKACASRKISATHFGYNPDPINENTRGQDFRVKPNFIRKDFR